MIKKSIKKFYNFDNLKYQLESLDCHKDAEVQNQIIASAIKSIPDTQKNRCKINFL